MSHQPTVVQFLDLNTLDSAQLRRLETDIKRRIAQNRHQYNIMNNAKKIRIDDFDFLARKDSYKTAIQKYTLDLLTIENFKP